MTSFPIDAQRLDWADIACQLDEQGHATIPGILSSKQAQALASVLHVCASQPPVARAACDLGRGELYRFANPLPEPLAVWRKTFYAHLAPMANRWNQALGHDARYPAQWEAFAQRNREAGQHRPLSQLNHLGESDWLALHQHNEGTHVFPLQLVALLSAPGADFTGGEFIMVEQRPRMQSRPMVLPLGPGDLAIISTAHRPVKGRRGDYRVNLKHAISRVRSGQRMGLELLFHDAPS